MKGQRCIWLSKLIGRRMVRIAIAGAAGRMGRSLIEAFTTNTSDSKVTVATVLTKIRV